MSAYLWGLMECCCVHNTTGMLDDAADLVKEELTKRVVVEVGGTKQGCSICPEDHPSKSTQFFAEQFYIINSMSIQNPV